MLWIGAAGSLAIIIGGLWLLVLAFRQSVSWGLAALVIPLANVVFGFLYREVAGRALLTYLSGFALVGIVIANGGIEKEPLQGSKTVGWQEGWIEVLEVEVDLTTRLEVTNRSSTAVDIYLVTARGAEHYERLQDEAGWSEIERSQVLVRREGLKGTYTSTPLTLRSGEYALIIDNSDTVGYSTAEIGSTVTVDWSLAVEP